jgi:hypothetical protein
MARRRDIGKDDVMSPEELRQVRQRLSGLGRSALLQAYNTAYARCRMVNDRVPSARFMQELVQVWKQLWNGRGGSSGEPRA